MAREKNKQKENAVQTLGTGYAALKAQMQKPKKDMEKLKATDPIPVGHKTE